MAAPSSAASKYAAKLKDQSWQKKIPKEFSDAISELASKHPSEGGL